MLTLKNVSNSSEWVENIQLDDLVCKQVFIVKKDDQPDQVNTNKYKMEKKLYVGNLSYDATREDVQSLFENYGTVSDVFIVKDRESGRPRGFAFVTMETKESMDAAIEGLNGEEFMGRNLAINEARPREERSGNKFNERRGNNNEGGYRGRRGNFNENNGGRRH